MMSIKNNEVVAICRILTGFVEVPKIVNVKLYAIYKFSLLESIQV